MIEAFADAGFPLPAELQETLRDWQGRVGRHQLYDNLGVIEFSDDLTVAEVQATTGLGRADSTLSRRAAWLCSILRRCPRWWMSCAARATPRR